MSDAKKKMCPILEVLYGDESAECNGESCAWWIDAYDMEGCSLAFLGSAAAHTVALAKDTAERMG